MPKTLVVCIDGTWNVPGQTDKDPVTEEECKTSTNVARTWEALTSVSLDKSRPYGSLGRLFQQEGAAIYLNGVGSVGTKVTKLYEGATGSGTSERIRDGYRFLAERWEPGDRILGFGFSRGAFAIRSLAGFINYIGMPKTPTFIKEDELVSLYEIYKEKKERPNWTVDAKIDFLGLWDTVSALAFGKTSAKFHEINPPNVGKVCHALALDEERTKFSPEFWSAKIPSQSQSVEEVWFAGAHTNVGGGYVDSNLSNIALFWMLNKASSCGLVLNLLNVDGYYQEDTRGMRRPSYHEFWKKIPIIGGFIEELEIFKQNRELIYGQKIHESVKDM